MVLEKNQGHSLQRQISTANFVLVVLAVLTCLCAALYYSLTAQQRAIDSSIRNTAYAIARIPDTLEALQNGAVSSEYTAYLDDYLLQAENVDVLVICNTASVRLYHPDKTQVGQHFVGGDEAAALAGQNDYITTEQGTLGAQRRAFFSIYDHSGRVVGFVMASVLTETLRATRNRVLLVFGLIAALLLVLGLGAARLISTRIRKTLLGYEPQQLSKLFLQRCEVFDAMEEGVYAIDESSAVIVKNPAAQRMLAPLPAGSSVAEVLHLNEALQGGSRSNEQLALGDTALLYNCAPLRESGHVIGAVAILRDKTEVVRLAEQLTGAQYMVETLRAFTHEFKNKLHVILGYIQMGQPQLASQLILSGELTSVQAVSQVSKALQNPSVAALVIGKILRAAELGIPMELQAGSYCTPQAALPTDQIITVLGNLLQNSIDALDTGEHPVRSIVLGVYCDERCAIVSVDDTAGGIAPEVADTFLQSGVSTKGEGRGTGLALVAQIMRDTGGTLTIDSEPGEGTSITAVVECKEEV